MTPGAVAGPGGYPLAEWWQRLVAVIIDSFILGIGTSIVTRVLPFFLGLVLALVGGWIYFTYFTGNTGQTPGKMVLKLKAVDINTGEVIGINRAAIRSAIYPLASTFTCGLVGIIDGIMLFTDQRRQTLHDKVANTTVVVLPS